jgi:translation elongation factor EF-4
MLLFDAYHDDYRGVICLVEIVDGELRKGDRVVAFSSGEAYDILEVKFARHSLLLKRMPTSLTNFFSSPSN